MGKKYLSRGSDELRDEQLQEGESDGSHLHVRSVERGVKNHFPVQVLVRDIHMVRGNSAEPVALHSHRLRSCRILVDE